MIEAGYSVRSLLLYMLHVVIEIHKMIGTCVSCDYDYAVAFSFDDPAIINPTYIMRNQSMFLKRCKVPFYFRLGLSHLNNVILINIIRSSLMSLPLHK